jgi:KipI family sensor histidine kinase inhibitor
LLQLDGIDWKVSDFGYQVLLLEPDVDTGHLEYIHHLYHWIEVEQPYEITDVVPAYTSIAIFYSSTREELVKKLQHSDFSAAKTKAHKTINVEVDYEEGLDLEHVVNKTGYTKSEVISRHSAKIYTVATIGFIPGFIFLEGLDPAISIPRLESPRTKVPSGSVGIGGIQTGIYSLESPGGWNIIGRTSNSFFDVEKNPPITISPGDKLKFIPISV